MGPNLIIVAGPNGAGKTTAAADILVGALAVQEFVNADIIAKGLSSFQPESVAFDAGRIMLQRLHHLTAQRADVAFETTLASRTFASWIKTLTPTGYEFHLFSFGCHPPTWPSPACGRASWRAAITCRKRPSGGATMPA
jgi:predicted ABC-type ATPase